MASSSSKVFLTPSAAVQLQKLESQLEQHFSKAEKLQDELTYLFRRHYDRSEDAICKQLAELRTAFNVMKKLPICGGCQEHFDFKSSVVRFLVKISPEPTTENICKWIENEYAKLAPRGMLYNFAFIRALFDAVMAVSGHFRDLNLLNEKAFRRWAPILHRFTTDHNVATSQILLFVVQDYAATKKYPKSVLFFVLRELNNASKFLAYIDKQGLDKYPKCLGIQSLDNWNSIVMNCLIFNAERYPEYRT